MKGCTRRVRGMYAFYRKRIRVVYVMYVYVMYVYVMYAYVMYVYVVCVRYVRVMCTSYV